MSVPPASAGKAAVVAASVSSVVAQMAVDSKSTALKALQVRPGSFGSTLPRAGPVHEGGSNPRSLYSQCRVHILLPPPPLWMGGVAIMKVEGSVKHLRRL